MNYNNIRVQNVNYSLLKKFDTSLIYESTINSINPAPAYSWKYILECYENIRDPESVDHMHIQE